MLRIKKVIEFLLVGSTIITEGRIIKENKEAKEILPGLQISYTFKPPREGVFASLPFNF